MHDIKFIRNNPEAFDAGLIRRGLAPLSGEILKLDEEKRKSQTTLQELLAKRNGFAKTIGEAKRTGADTTAIMAEAKQVNDEIARLEGTLAGRGALEEMLETIPNLPAADVPDGEDEHGNVEVRVVGVKPKMDFAPKAHDELGVNLGLMDFDAAAKLSGARFVVLKGALARMERALASFMLDIHTNEFGYTEHVPPFLVKDNAMYGTGQLPKFKEDLFSTSHWDIDTVANAMEEKVQELLQQTGNNPNFDLDKIYKDVMKEIKSGGVSDRRWLIPTAEVPLTNLHADSIIDAESLPIRMTAYTPCFRSEAGAAGKDTRGMVRQHQFSKVELVSVVAADKSGEEHERMTACAEEILKRLGLHYRVMLLCTGDMGFGAQKTYDLEVWLPAQNTFREISSCSNCGAFQARRMKARSKAKGAKETEFVHTLNGSGLAIGRTMVAILENYQNADGSITVPEALQPYMGGLMVIANA
jgi:seryl-tRNA synthetase